MLRVEKISAAYGTKTVLSDISFQLREGMILGLLGPNGAGKTTLLKTLNLAVPVSSGVIELNGKPLRDLSRREIAQNITVVAQENETKFAVTVREYILAGRFAYGRAFGWETEKDLDAAEASLSECDLEDYGSRIMNELSGGERQRVALARAIATEASILLLDEPTANLDLSHQAGMLRLVREKCRVSGRSAVVITHDLNLAAEFADYTLLLNKGRLAAFGKPEAVLTEANIRGVYSVDILLDEHPLSKKLRVTNIY